MSPNRLPAQRPVQLDDVSKAIIEQLQADGRRSYASIGKVVGLSEAAVRQRVQRLVESGVMQVVAVTDPLQLGFARQAMIGVTVNGPLESVADALADLDEVLALPAARLTPEQSIAATIYRHEELLRLGRRAEATVALVSSSGAHLHRDRPFDLYSDASFRVIPGGAAPDDLQLTHRGYDRRDAAQLK